MKRILRSCYGDKDEPSDAKSTPNTNRVAITKKTTTDVSNGRPLEPAYPLQTIAETAKTQSQRRQSEQSQPNAKQQTTQSSVAESSTKVDSDIDKIASTEAPAPQPSDTSNNADLDPDAITPVAPQAPMYANVKQCLEDRRALYDRLRRKPEGQFSHPEAHQTPSQTTTSPPSDPTNAPTE